MFTVPAVDVVFPPLRGEPTGWHPRLSTIKTASDIIARKAALFAIRTFICVLFIDVTMTDMIVAGFRIQFFREAK